MQRSSRYYHLGWLVEVRDTIRASWEPIAAFNLGDVATDYAKDCTKNKLPGFFCRVVERRGNRYVVTWDNLPITATKPQPETK